MRAPLLFAVERGADRPHRRLAVARAQHHLIAVDVHAHGVAVVPGPAPRALVVLVWRIAARAHVADVFLLEPILGEHLPEILTRRDRPVVVVEAVPEVGLFARWHRFRAQAGADDVPFLVGHRQADLRRLRQFERDRNVPGGPLDPRLLRQLQVPLAVHDSRAPRGRPHVAKVAAVLRADVGHAGDRLVTARIAPLHLPLRLHRVAVLPRLLQPEELPRHAVLERIALAVGILLVGGLHLRRVEVHVPKAERVADHEAGLLVAGRIPEIEMADVFLILLGHLSAALQRGLGLDRRIRDQPELDAVGVPHDAHVAGEVVGVRHRRRILDPAAHVERLLVVHVGALDPHRRAAGIVKKEIDRARHVPVGEIAVDHHLAGRRHDVDLLVVGLVDRGQVGRGRRRQAREHDAEHADPSLVAAPHGNLRSSVSRPR